MNKLEEQINRLERVGDMLCAERKKLVLRNDGILEYENTEKVHTLRNEYLGLRESIRSQKQEIESQLRHASLDYSNCCPANVWDTIVTRVPHLNVPVLKAQKLPKENNRK